MPLALDDRLGSRTRWLLVLSVGLSMLGSGCATTAATGSPARSPGDVTLWAPPPSWKLGEEWTYRWESPRGQGTFVWTVDREEIIDSAAYYVLRSGPTRESYFRKADLAFYMDKVNGLIETRYTPPISWIPWPLKPGVTRELRYAHERPIERQTDEVVRVCESVAEETVTVPAGTFETVKVVCRDGERGPTVYEVWYSLAAKQWVRERNHFAYGVRERELIAYKLR